MQSIRKSINRPAAMCLAALAAVVSYQTVANRPEPVPVVETPARPTNVGTLDLRRLFENLTERAVADADIMQMAEELEAEQKQMREGIESLKGDLEALQPGTEKYKTAEEKLVMATAEFRAQQEFWKGKLDVEKAITLRRLYDASVKGSLKEFAVKEGLDLVIVDDSRTQLPAGTEETMLREITARRIVYANPEIDVTDRLIAFMNDAFKKANPDAAAKVGAAKPADGG